LVCPTLLGENSKATNTKTTWNHQTLKNNLPQKEGGT